MTDEEIIDNILSRAKESKSGIIQVKRYLKEIIGEQDDKLLQRILNRMAAEYIGTIADGGVLMWLPGGRQIADEGFLKIFDRKEKEKDALKEHEQIIREKDKVTLSLSKYQFRYRWLPIIAIGIPFVSLLFSFWALFIKK